MEIFIVLIICGFVIWVVLNQKWQAPTTTQADKKTLHAYETRGNIFVNQAENAFFYALIRHMPRGFHVFTKVRLEDVLRVRLDIKDQRLKWQYRGRIKSRHVDFVICKGDGSFVCAIELDGSSHKTAQAELSDSFKDAIFSHAQFPLYRLQTGDDFDAYAKGLWNNIQK
ncbi:MAG: hypothetical protein COA43_09455 [Robiginitomaculum sp.]|nr:MAG: hypothetical protein COA43_09455 [Robiginitomaculum sp.]